MRIDEVCSKERNPYPSMSLARVTVAWMVITVFVAATAIAQVTFQDENFNDADWTMTVLYTTGNGGSGSAGQSAGGGNPDAHRLVTHNMNTRPARLGLVHERAGAIYDPQTQGAVGAVDFSFDAKTFVDPGYGGQSATLTIRQDDVVYLGPYFANGDDVWRSTEHAGLGATDFAEWDAPNHPDFSNAGEVLQFGFLTSNHNPPDGIIGSSTTIVGYDNWSVTIVTATSGVQPGPVTTQLVHAAMPNPFARDTVIRFTLEEAAGIRVRICDATGRAIRLFQLDRSAPGAQSVAWDGLDSAGRPTPTGVYFYSIDAGMRTAMGQVMRLR